VRAYAEVIIARRWLVLALSLLIAILLGLQLRNLTVIVDADELLPRDHPFVEVTERVQSLFGNRYTVVIGITPHSGDVYTPETLGKVIAATDALAATPGVTPGNLQSLAAPRAKHIGGDAEGLIVQRLLETVPASRAEALTIRDRLAENPHYENVLVSADARTASIYVEFQKDPKGFGEIARKVEAVVAPLRSDTVSVAVAGQPIFLGKLETYSKRMAWLLPIAILFIGLIHLEAFRTIQGLILPLVTAILALIWSLGIMTLAGVHLDPFNNVTPTLATSQTFDLIFMDRQLGNGGCGLAATQQIRAAAVSAPIIGLSADGTASQITAAASAGMTGLIVKPIDLRHGLAAALDKARFPPASPKQAGA
jgi:predicted RND superfamily exporter protein